MKDNVVQLFLRIVQIDSPSGDEQAMAKYLKGELSQIGFKYYEDKTGSILTTSFDKPEILICAHMDTVEPGRSIKPIINDGYVYSSSKTILGADNKAAISAIICAIKEYKNNHKKLPNIELLFTVKEETGGGIEFFPFNKIKSKIGVIFDYAQPLGRIIMSSPYIYNIKATFTGKAAHASRPDEGINSLLPAIRFISSIPHGSLDRGKTTINIGQVNSGTGINIIPEETVVWGEVRSIDQKLFNTHLASIKANAVKISKEFGVNLDFEVDGYCPGYKYSKNDPLIKKIDTIYQGLNLATSYDKSAGISDTNLLINGGIKTVNLSDSCEKPHTVNERVSINNLEKLQELVLNIIEKFTA